MNILLLTIGSAGDVHPFIGLGLALKARGHRVKIITNPFFGEIANKVGLELIPLGTAEKFRETLEDPLIWHHTKGHRDGFGYRPGRASQKTLAMRWSTTSCGR